MDPPRFHLSIPSSDLAATERWYVQGLGCAPGRRSERALILDLGGHQLVAQRTEESGPLQPGIYPRHFGLVFATLAAWEALRDRACRAGLRFGVEPKCRFPGEELEHHTFFLIDPDHNWLEFKHYRQAEAILGCRHLGQVGDGELRLRARLLEFLKFRVLAAQEQFDADLRDAEGRLDPARLRPWLARQWPEALALPDGELLATLEQARALYTESGSGRP